MADRDSLKGSSAGMRLIALLTIYNNGDPARLRALVQDSLHADLVAEKAVDIRAAELSTLRAVHGRLRVRQVIGVSKEQTLTLLNAESGADVLVEIQVEPEYPHAVTAIGFNVIDADGAEGAEG